MTFLPCCVHTSLFNRAFFSLLMISSLFGNSTLWHSREMSMFGWGRISVVLDLLGTLFLSALNVHFTGSAFSFLIQDYHIIIKQWETPNLRMHLLIKRETNTLELFTSNVASMRYIFPWSYYWSHVNYTS